ncbi:hypothetical protein GF391_02355 [Candidatus Uhrbacteria bacterium]|nr:hypothetical protein [Candidatus Uhrbacteria bacterium]
MLEKYFRFADIEFGNSPTNENIVGVFRFEQGKQNKQGPYHIIVAEIDSALYAYEQLLDTINATVEQSRTLMAGMALDPFARFEKLIERVNEAIALFQEQEPTPINWDRLNIYIIECSGDQLCLSGHGKLANIFLKKEGEVYKNFDLCGSLEQPSETDPKKVFASLICGDMQPGDMFFIGTNNFNQYKEQLRIKERLEELPMVSAATEIKKDLEKENYLEDFVAITIGLKADEGPVFVDRKVKKQAEESLKGLHDKEEEVQDTLAPAINPLKGRKQDTETSAKPKVPLPVAGLQKSWSAVLHAATKFIKKRGKTTPSSETALRGLHAGKGSFLTTKRKIILGLIGVAVILGLVMFFSWQRNKQVVAEQAAWEQSFAEVTDLRNRAENDLLYAKDTQASSRIKQAEQILSSLDVGTDDRQSRIESIRSEFEKLKKQLRKEVAVSGIIELHSLPVIAQDGMLTAPILTESKAYAVDNQERKILSINLATRQVNEITLPDPAGKIIGGALGEQSVVFYDDEGKFYAVSVEDDDFTPLNSFTRASSTSDFTLYNKRAYVLDSAAGQIHRINASRAGFSGASTYFDGGDDLARGAVSFAIDSNVYVAKSNGTVTKYLSGEQEAFGLGTVEPALRSISAIWTDTDDPRLLVTDPAEKRLLIFDKNGLLQAQLTSDEFGALRDVSSRLNAKQALVVSDNRLLLVPLP